MAFNYGIGNFFAKGSFKRVSKKSLLWFAIFLNILLLGYFKYMDFFISNMNYITGENIGLYHLALPQNEKRISQLNQLEPVSIQLMTKLLNFG